MATVMAKIAPSMLSSDFANLASEAEKMIKFGADCLHMDIMDGHFVPNLTIGAPVIEGLRKRTKAYLDCHLMVTNPLDYVEPLGKAGASGFTFHVEASKDNWQEIIEKVKAKGMRAGVALKPGTPIEEVYPLVCAAISVGIDSPKIEVRFENLSVEGDVFGASRALPTMFNASLNTMESGKRWISLDGDICADTMVGGAMARGMSGGQKKRVTTGMRKIHIKSNFRKLDLVESLLTDY
ncbi:hypothetical protein MKX03_001488 [Papaver bracteatum]|nr:hypothetical protein MKX03_001488 [Papaver bracteatum]